MSWVLRRGFGPLGGAIPALPDPGLVDLARRLDLAPRIASRIAREALHAEAGPSGAAAFAAARGVAALGNERHESVAREAAVCAAGLGIPVVLLKGVALHLTGRTPIDARASSDVDLLVPEGSLDVLSQALYRQGFRPDRGGPTCEHQVPSLHRASGECLDLHRFLPGVRLPGERGFAGMHALGRHGLVERAPSMPGDAFVPAPGLLAAHALVHGVAQHGFAPWSYPGTRMLADLVDLGWGDAAGRPAFDEAVRLVSHVAPPEARAVWDTCAVLREGALLPSVLRGDGSPAHALLAHVLAGATDPAYRDALRLRALGSSPSRLPHAFAWVRDAARAMAPSRAQTEALHAGPASPLRVAVLRLARPFDLAGRALRATVSAARLRLRPRRVGARMNG